MCNYVAIEMVSEWLIESPDGCEVTVEAFSDYGEAVDFAINLTRSAGDTNKTVIGIYDFSAPIETKRASIWDIINESAVDFTKPLALVHCGKVFEPICTKSLTK